MGLKKRIEKTRNLSTVLKEIAIICLSSLVFSFAFPGFLSEKGIGFIAFFALIPIFYIIKKTTYLASSLYGFLFAFTFYCSFNYWLSTFHPLAILIAPIIKGFEMLILFLVLKYCLSITKKRGYLLQTLVFVSYYYLSQSWFAGYPYGNIAYAFYRYIPLIQIVNIAGIWPLCFIIILPQALVGNNLDKLKEFKIDLIVYSILMLFVLIYGFATIAKDNQREVQRYWKVATLQHNSDSWEGGYQTYKKNFDMLKLMSYQSALKDPDIVVWSETALVPSIYWHSKYNTDPRMKKLINEFTSFAKSFECPLLLGNGEGRLKDKNLPPVLKDGSYNRDDYNSVVLYQDGKLDESYHKQHLVPFTEYFPYEDVFPSFYSFLVDNGYVFWVPGDKATVFESDNVKFSTPICFEDVFGYLTSEFVRQGAQVIINLTNDSWSKAVSAETQHSAIAVFRSVETKVPTVRSTNSGITCMIDTCGRIIDPLKPFTKASCIYYVPIYKEYKQTLYTKYGDTLIRIVTYINILILIGLTIKKVLRKKNEE